MKILDLDHVQLTVSRADEAAALDFYTRVLELPRIPKPASLEANGGFWCRLGERQLHIGLEDGVDRHATKAHAGFLVDDLTAWREHLLAAGLQISESTPIPGIDRFECRDPFGNRLEFLQPH